MLNSKILVKRLKRTESVCSISLLGIGLFVNIGEGLEPNPSRCANRLWSSCALRGTMGRPTTTPRPESNICTNIQISSPSRNRSRDRRCLHDYTHAYTN